MRKHFPAIRVEGTLRLKKDDEITFTFDRTRNEYVSRRAKPDGGTEEGRVRAVPLRDDIWVFQLDREAGVPRLWDQRIGHWIARRIAGTRLRPNHVTAVDLVVGLASGVAIAIDHPDLGALLFLVARLIDCVDGELARIQGTSSKFGEYFDLFAGTCTYLSFFAGLAVWSYLHENGEFVSVLLLIVLAAVMLNTVLLLVRQKLLHDRTEEFPTLGRLNLEDGAYLIPVGIWLGFPFETFAFVSIGAALFVLWHSLQTARRAVVLLRSRG